MPAFFHAETRGQKMEQRGKRTMTMLEILEKKKLGKPLSRASDAVLRYDKDAPLVASERQTGCVVCVRNEKNEDETFRVAPRKIDANAKYRWENLDSGESTTLSGSALAAGVDVKLPKRSGAVWKYTRLADQK